jgi:hypothetical protein
MSIIHLGDSIECGITYVGDHRKHYSQFTAYMGGRVSHFEKTVEWEMSEAYWIEHAVKIGETE